MQRAMAKEAEAERERRAKIVAAQGEFQAAQKLGEAADVIAAHPSPSGLRTLQTMAEISTEKNSTIIFPAQSHDDRRGSFQDAEAGFVDEITFADLCCAQVLLAQHSTLVIM